VNFFGEVLFHFDSGCGLPGSGMIFSGSDSGSGSGSRSATLAMRIKWKSPPYNEK
jgi:hypothetical protein